VLGALEDEVPAQMAKHDQGRHVDFLSPWGVLVDLDSRPATDASMLGKHRQIRCRTSESYHANFLRFSFMHCNICIRKGANGATVRVSLGELGRLLNLVSSLLRGQ
jgi:hypothetical protein